MKTARFLIVATFILAIFAVSSAFVQAEDYTYVTNNGTITITKYLGPGGEVTIPETINDLPVASIGGAAFDLCTLLTGVKIPDSVTSIGAFAFCDCTGLRSATIGNGVTNIGNSAFSFCKSLASITIPDSVISIGIGEPISPGHGEGTFKMCTSLTNVTIGNSVTYIWAYALEDCVALTSLTIGGSVTNIGYAAFRRCGSLTSVTLPASVTSIEGGAFDGCTSLTGITVDPLNPYYSSLKGVLFDKNQTTLVEFPKGKAGSYTIPNSVTSIGDYGFYGCTSLTKVTVPDSVTSMGRAAFRSCINLSRVDFEGNAPVLSSDVFGGDANVIVYYLPGTIGWGDTYAERPTAPWVLPYPLILATAPSFGIQANVFGFRISWATNASVVVEASPTLANPVWSPVRTNTLTDGWSYFSDAEWTNDPARFYRVRHW